MKRFAYVCADPGIPVPGSKGASIHVASVCRALRDAGLEGEIHCSRPHVAELAGLPVRPIHADGFDAAACRAGCDFIYERYSLWHLGGLFATRGLGIPFILEVNSPLPDEARAHRGLAEHEAAEGTALRLLKEADAVVCVSGEVARWVSQRRGHDRGVWEVPNGVDAELFAPGPGIRPRGLARNLPLVAFAGSFRPWHALDDLAIAFARLVERVPEARLLCLGDGPARRSFARRVRDCGLEAHVHFTGALPHDEVPRWLRGADVGVAPYPELAEFYFSPLKIFEFLSLGLPVVAGAAGQIPEVIRHGERGLLYRPGDTAELADRMAALLLRREEGRRLGAAGRAWVLEHATWTKRVATILGRIERLRNSTLGVGP